MFSFFRKKPILPKSTLDFIGVDIHNHLFPGIDDGSPGVHESLALIEVLMQLGLKQAYTTPHVISDVHPNTPVTITQAYAQLEQACLQKGFDRFLLGYSAEYMINYDLEQIIKNLEIIPLAQHYVLVEMSYAVESPNIKEVLFQVQTKRLRPILAHPERYPYLHRDFNLYETLLDAGAEFQINLLSLNGYYGKGVQKVAEKLIDRQWVNWVGTDLHHGRHLAALVALSNDKHALGYLQKIKHLRNASLARG